MPLETIGVTIGCLCVEATGTVAPIILAVASGVAIPILAIAIAGTIYYVVTTPEQKASHWKSLKNFFSFVLGGKMHLA
ncbi:unnamed protein product [Darwinula stevensoni]|uniref:Uncharacterized protein n=1 Tax=Darwinula stevensoni TaxID=69355 RepID=A0A7R8XFY9_9CRUS|nr:unnamed protein product [Darwinula stevensoni]CAG0895981.1 unnamed protein product [Darwinula stevensoni]